MIFIHILPGVTWTKEEFLKNAPPFSIALDGMVASPPFREITERGPYANFDHHTGVDRIATRATCYQVYLEINSGLFDLYQDNGNAYCHVFVNDIDQDTALAIWMLQNHTRILGHAEPIINKLVVIEDLLDSTAGAYQLGDRPVRKELDWVFEPYVRARFEGQIKGASEFFLRTILDAICYRISQYTAGHAGHVELGGKSTVIKRANTWSLVEESGPRGRELSFKDNQVVIVYLGPRAPNKDGEIRHDYTIAKRGPWAAVELKKVYQVLNANDPISKPGNTWGGSDLVGGSPRETGSSLTPDQVFDLMKQIYA